MYKTRLQLFYGGVTASFIRAELKLHTAVLFYFVPRKAGSAILCIVKSTQGNFCLRKQTRDLKGKCLQVQRALLNCGQHFTC